jgi:transposase-like protein
VQTELGPVQVRAPRDRKRTFEPRLVAKRQTRLAGQTLSATVGTPSVLTPRPPFFVISTVLTGGGM